jgi:hypothetical protein
MPLAMAGEVKNVRCQMNIAFPLSFDQSVHTAAVDVDRHIRQMLELLLFTNHGERVNRPDFGSAMAQLVFDTNSAELAVATRFALQAALQRWLGDLIEVQAAEVIAEESTLTVTVRYAVRGTDQTRTAELSGVVS